MFYRRKRLVFAQFCTFLFIIFGRKLHIIAHYYIILRNFALNFLKQHTHRRKRNAPIYLRSAGQFSITIYRSIFRVCIRPTCQFWGLSTVYGSIFGSPPDPDTGYPYPLSAFHCLLVVHKSRQTTWMSDLETMETTSTADTHRQTIRHIQPVYAGSGHNNNNSKNIPFVLQSFRHAPSPWRLLPPTENRNGTKTFCRVGENNYKTKSPKRRTNNVGRHVVVCTATVEKTDFKVSRSTKKQSVRWR